MMVYPLERSITLYGTSRSPFARRVRLALLMAGIEFEWKDLALKDLFPPSTELLGVNPLGLVPVFVDQDGFAIFDSNEILAHIDSHFIKLWPSGEPQRKRSRRLSALAQGILTYAVREFQNLRVKSSMSDFVEDNIELIERSLKWIETDSVSLELFFWGEKEQTSQALDRSLERKLSISAPTLTQAAIDVGCALEYLDFRLSDKINWREHCPSLVQVFANISEIQFFDETRPKL